LSGACRDYRLGREFIGVHTPEQNGIVERLFRSLKDATAATKAPADRFNFRLVADLRLLRGRPRPTTI
jgi:transposase InsO family protein